MRPSWSRERTRVQGAEIRERKLGMANNYPLQNQIYGGRGGGKTLRFTYTRMNDQLETLQGKGRSAKPNLQKEEKKKTR